VLLISNILLHVRSPCCVLSPALHPNVSCSLVLFFRFKLSAPHARDPSSSSPDSWPHVHAPGFLTRISAGPSTCTSELYALQVAHWYTSLPPDRLPELPHLQCCPCPLLATLMFQVELLHLLCHGSGLPTQHVQPRTRCPARLGSIVTGAPASQGLGLALLTCSNPELPA
jgi:hypothetical protein